VAGLSPVVRGLRALGIASWLVARSGRGIGPDLVGRDPLVARRMAEALGTYLWAPLPVLVALAVLVGIVAGTAAARLLGLFHVELAIEPALAASLCRDVVPLLIGLFAAGRVSVDLAARLAGASLAREIDALDVLGRDPVRHFLSPALFGVMIAVPVHMLVAATCTLATTGLVIDVAHETRWATYLQFVTGTNIARALVGGVVKAWLFALIAFAVGAAVGGRGVRNPAEVGARATTAFTAGLLAIFAADALWTVLA
jgi:ABC-type transporter Mla maintaining outer membrane lipid asymmetry permease subunit MlaE